MSDYDDKETSLSDSAPYELYEFVGTYRSYLMTSDNIQHTFLSQPFLPVAGLRRSSIKIGTHEDEGADISVIIPITEQICKDFAFQTTPPKLELALYRFQRDAIANVVYWKGPVKSIAVNLEEVTFKVPSKFAGMLQGNIPNVHVQPPCNNVLFDELCKVSRTANSLDTTVSTVSGRTVTIPSTGGFPEGWFIGGEIAVPARNERRMIVGQSGTVLTINYEFAKLSTGTAIQVTAGCDHSYEGPNGCPKFNNKRNFTGTPFVPGESNNVFVSGV